MSDTDYDFEDFENGEDNSPAGLRKALKKAQAEAKKANEALAEERKARTTAEQAVKKSTLTDLLKGKGIKPELARWLEKDDVEATPEAVDAWVKENGEFFNIKAEKTEESTEQVQEQDAPDAEQEAAASALPPELIAALQASQQLDASGVSPSDVSTITRLASVKADPRKVSYEDLVSQLAELGAPLD